MKRQNHLFEQIITFENIRKANNWFLKLDIRKFFDSISHGILKNQLRRLFKDQRLLFLLDGLIDSYHTSPATGLPIGNLTSQFFANQYLSSMDHYILEKLRPKAYVRYMDDFVLWADSKETLAEYFTTLKSWIYDSLSLSEYKYGTGAASGSNRVKRGGSWNMQGELA